jgi:ComF family protein
LDGIISMAGYSDSVLQELLQLYKYGGVFEARDALDALFRGFLRRESEVIASLIGNAVVVPVPLHIFRFASRGFNQAELFASALADTIGAELCTNVLRRRFQWKAQAMIEDALKRALNARGSVFLRTGVAVPKRFVIVDDVCTSGATLNECARILKDAGVEWVWGVTVLRG